MTVFLKNNTKVFIRPYVEGDIDKIQNLNKDEGWSNLVENHMNTKEAWKNSNVSFVVETETKNVIGYIRGFTDTRISLFICELLIDKMYRGFGLGKELIHYVHNLYPQTRVELLANRSSRTFYEGLGFRAFYGFRKTSHE